MIKTWERELVDELQQKTRLQTVGLKTGSICCRKCNRKLGKLEWLKRRHTTYFINNPKFLADNDCRLDDVHEKFHENLVMGSSFRIILIANGMNCFFFLGKVLCTCGNSLGGFQKFLDRSDLSALCALSCKQIKFLIEDKQPFVEFIQWSKNDRFDVEELEEN